MDLNLVVLSGTLAASPELRVLENESRLIRYLVAVRSRGRLDVLPVISWEVPDRGLDAHPGQRLWVTATLQRRFWEQEEGRRSRLEVIAHGITVRPPDGDRGAPG